jgi:hypothetical protein
MEAANRGAHDAGARSVGFNITLEHEQVPNSYVSPDLAFQFRYFGIRKMHFLLRAVGLVAFPGGLGTADEVYEALTLVQTEKMAPIPVVLVRRDYWRSVLPLELLADGGFVDADDVHLARVVDTGAEAWDAIKEFHAARGVPAGGPLHRDVTPRQPRP